MEEVFDKNFQKVFDSLNEFQKRWMAAAKAIELGYGGISKVHRSTGLSRVTITKGIQEIKRNKKLISNKSEDVCGERIRSVGGGRKEIDSDGKILQSLEEILDGSVAGDPCSLLRWTCKSSRNLQEALLKKGIQVSHESVRKILKRAGYSLQSNKKMLSGINHPDRNEQFEYINSQVKDFIKDKNPVISVDTKKKELVGNFKNPGQNWSKKGEGQKVLDHDFKSYGLGVAIPYGAYDLEQNEGFVNVGISSETSEFAVNSIWQWWRHFGRKRYKESEKILICADGGGSNGSRRRAWKFYLQDLANKTGLEITVCHYPPGTSKWNKIEHKMFSYISMNWKGRPLESYESIIKLISSTKTKSGLKIKANLDKKKYMKNKKISKKEFESIKLQLHKKFPSWNYTIKSLS